MIILQREPIVAEQGRQLICKDLVLVGLKDGKLIKLVFVPVNIYVRHVIQLEISCNLVDRILC